MKTTKAGSAYSRLHRFGAFALALGMAGSLMACTGGGKDTSSTPDSGSSSSTVNTGNIKEVRFGSHYIATWDPSYRDEVTGETIVSPEQMEVIETATKAVKDQLGVDIKWVQWTHGVGEDLLPSVLSGEPICDLAMISCASQGGIIEQGIIRDLTPFTDIFTGSEDTSWMLMDSIFGKRMFLNFELSYFRTGPLLFNINYIEQVDALKENGKTVYPTDLYKQGKWTWSAFQDYLTKIKAYYADKGGPIRPEKMINAYETDYRFAVRAAMVSNGVSIYGKNGFDDCTTPEAIQAVNFIKTLADKKLMISELENGLMPGFTWSDNNFGNGESVFIDSAIWLVSSAGSRLAARGESLGIVPWPRPDSLSADDAKYQQVSTPNDSFVLLKGVPDEQARVALEAYKIYYEAYYAAKSGGTKAMDFFSDANAEKEALANNLDIYHAAIGNDVLDIFKTYCPMNYNDYSNMLSQMTGFTMIAGGAMYDEEGSSYEVGIAENIGALKEAIGKIEAAAQKVN